MAFKGASLGGKLTTMVLLVCLLVGALASAVNWYFIKQSRETTFIQTLIMTLDNQLHGLLAADQSGQFQFFANNLMALSFIDSVSLENARGNSLAHVDVGSHSSSDHLTRIERSATPTAGLSASNLAGDGLNLVVWVDLDKIDMHASPGFVITFLFSLTASLVLGVALLLILRAQVTRPVESLFKYATERDAERDGRDETESPHEIREFDDLIKMISELFDSIDREMSKRLSAEQDFQILRDELEQKVEARTDELNGDKLALEKRLDELQETQKLLLQAQKMAALGHLAAGVAHEINNPVAAVYSNIATMGEYLAELVSMTSKYEASEAYIVDAGLRDALAVMRREMDLAFIKEEAPQLVENSCKSLDRVRSIVSELRMFAHFDPDKLEPVDLKTSLAEALSETELMADNRIRVDTYLEGLSPVPAVPAQIRLVFRNL
ncbi:MAG: sensor histidine kinase, partial [Oceanobacter sp.]